MPRFGHAQQKVMSGGPTLAELSCAVPLAAHEEPQGEAIGFSADGRAYFSISEGIQPSLHFYRALPRT